MTALSAQQLEAIRGRCDALKRRDDAWCTNGDYIKDVPLVLDAYAALAAELERCREANKAMLSEIMTASCAPSAGPEGDQAQRWYNAIQAVRTIVRKHYTALAGDEAANAPAKGEE